MNTILLHTCCGPCASSSVERLLEQGYLPTLYYSNSNIFPHEEFLKREEHAKKISNMFSIPIITAPWNHDAWLKAVLPFAGEPEGGKRCAACFRWNLEDTCRQANHMGIPNFATSLTVSPYKSSRMIFSIGRNLKGFCELDFKKQDGYKRSIELSRTFGLYRQDYCGCEFSMKYPPNP